jgi:hypothetical protein
MRGPSEVAHCDEKVRHRKTRLLRLAKTLPREMVVLGAGGQSLYSGRTRTPGVNSIRDPAIVLVRHKMRADSSSRDVAHRACGAVTTCPVNAS